MVLETVDDERRPAAQLGVETALVEAPARSPELEGEVGVTLLGDGPGVEQLKDGCRGLDVVQHAVEPLHGNGSRSARLASSGCRSRWRCWNSAGVRPKAIIRQRAATPPSYSVAAAERSWTGPNPGGGVRWCVAAS